MVNVFLKINLVCIPGSGNGLDSDGKEYKSIEILAISHIKFATDNVM